MGVSEIYHIDDVPPKVSISEMVEIAKVYSTEESSSFVNGILDTIYKKYSEQKNRIKCKNRSSELIKDLTEC